MAVAVPYLFGHRIAHNAKQAAALLERPFSPPPLTSEEIGVAWRTAGEAWAAQRERLLQKERGQTLIIAGHGAGLFVEKVALIVRCA